MNRYKMVCYDNGGCEYAEIEVTANDWTHALQRLAAQLPSESPKSIDVFDLGPVKE